MIGLVLGCALCFSLGWFARRWWEKKEALRGKNGVAPRLSPYEAKLSEFDRRMDCARAHHKQVKGILKEKQAYIKAQLEAAQGFDRELNSMSNVITRFAKPEKMDFHWERGRCDD